MPGEIRLQWWRDVLSGERGGEASANPVAAALMQTIARFALPAPRRVVDISAAIFPARSRAMNFGAFRGGFAPIASA